MARCARLPLSGCAIGHTFGVRVQRVQKVQRVQRGVVSPSRAMLMKSALRINLSASYVMKSILVISRCAAHPYPAAPDFLHGKACHTILRSLCSLTARLSPTHNILRVTAFLQNMFAGVTRVPLPPHPGDRINRSMFSCRNMAPLLNIHSATTKWWQGNLIRKEP